MTEKVLTGKIARSRIATLTLPTLPAGLIDAFRKIDEPTCAVSDALDELGIIGAIGSTTLKPTIEGEAIVGRALTLRNVVIGRDAFAAARDKDNRMAEVEAHNLAEKDDVIVVQGVLGNSNLGGNGMQLGKRQGEVGAIIDGGVRDIGHTRAIGFPVWAREFTPITGKWRVETVEINGPVVICGVVVNPGDLVIADQSGVCFVPYARAEEVLAFTIKKSQAEEASADRIDAGISVLDYASGGTKK